MLRIDLEDSLHHSDLSLADLSPFQRILLTTDGTVTEILEAQLWEKIQLIKVLQEFRSTEKKIPYLDLDMNKNIMVRKILLRGEVSKQNHIYAESIIVPERLDPDLQKGLHETDKPLGRLMIEEKTETFREILTCKYEQAEELARHFHLPEKANLISRTYRIFSNKKPIMLITEKFPQSSFTAI